MKLVSVDQSVPVFESYRTARVRSLFNVSADDGRRFLASAQIPVDESGWQIGLIVGPSGSGKSSIGRSAWGADAMHGGFQWPDGKPIIDAIGEDEFFDDVAAALSAVGLGSVPSWLRPFHVLSTGEKFRAELARLLLSRRDRVVFDEFTSVVDRQVAQIGAGAFAKAWRRQPGRQIILLSCHRDVVAWVQPDWMLDTEDYSFSRGCLCPRPPITFDVLETNWRPWKTTFERHHYLKLPNMIGATNYVAEVNGEPVAHVAVSTTTGLRSGRMCRLVVLPEWQGAGIGTRFIDHIAQRWLDGKNRYGKPMTTIFHTSHPGLAAALRRNRRWLYHGGRLLGESGLDSIRTMRESRDRQGKGRGLSKYGGHLRAVQGFRYIGGALA